MDFDKLRTLPAMTQEEFDRIQERILELASGEIKGGHMSNLEEMVFQALGEVSMCWSETPKGVFDSDHAKEVGERLVADIKRFYATANAPSDIMASLQNRLDTLEAYFTDAGREMLASDVARRLQTRMRYVGFNFPG